MKCSVPHFLTDKYIVVRKDRTIQNAPGEVAILERRVVTRHSMSFPIQDRRAMGWYEVGSLGSLPGLGTGMRVEDFQQVGKLPFVQLVL